MIVVLVLLRAYLLSVALAAVAVGAWLLWQGRRRFADPQYWRQQLRDDDERELFERYPLTCRVGLAVCMTLAVAAIAAVWPVSLLWATVAGRRSGG